MTLRLKGASRHVGPVRAAPPWTSPRRCESRQVRGFGALRRSARQLKQSCCLSSATWLATLTTRRKSPIAPVPSRLTRLSAAERPKASTTGRPLPPGRLLHRSRSPTRRSRPQTWVTRRPTTSCSETPDHRAAGMPSDQHGNKSDCDRRGTSTFSGRPRVRTRTTCPRRERPQRAGHPARARLRGRHTTSFAGCSDACKGLRTPRLPPPPGECHRRRPGPLRRP